MFVCRALLGSLSIVGVKLVKSILKKSNCILITVTEAHLSYVSITDGLTVLAFFRQLSIFILIGLICLCHTGQESMLMIKAFRFYTKDEFCLKNVVIHGKSYTFSQSIEKGREFYENI